MLEALSAEDAAPILGFDFAPLCWDHASRRGGFNPALVPECRAMLSSLVAGGEWLATTDGGWPRVGWGAVLGVELRDHYRGQPPVPCVLVANRVFGGAEWHCITSISEIRRKGVA